VVCEVRTESLYAMFQEGSTIHSEKVPVVNLLRYNHKHSYSKLSGYGDNREMIVKIESCYIFTD
jgi:hypothetical protein